MVFSGIYPINTADFEHLKAAMAKLQLNDSAFVFQEGARFLASDFAVASSGSSTWRYPGTPPAG